MIPLETTILLLAACGGALLIVHQVGHAVGSCTLLLAEYERLLRESREAEEPPEGP